METTRKVWVGGALLGVGLVVSLLTGLLSVPVDADPATSGGCPEAVSGPAGAIAAQATEEEVFTSCCDKSTLEILNNTSTGWTVDNVDVQLGTLSGIDEGYLLTSGFKLNGLAASSSGTQGDAKGSVTFVSGDSRDAFDLDYHFVAATTLGGCPCTSKVSSTNIHVDGYLAHAELKTGQHDAEARIKWNLDISNEEEAETPR